MTEPQTISPPPDGAQTMTPERARLIIDAVRAGVTPDQLTHAYQVVGDALPPAPAPAPPEPAKPEEPPFIAINPRIRTWHPPLDHVITGVLLGLRVDHTTGAAFYLLQLTAPAIMCASEDLANPPAIVAVYDREDLRAMRLLLQDVKTGYEVRLNNMHDHVALAARACPRRELAGPVAPVPDLPPPLRAVDAHGDLLPLPSTNGAD